MISKRTPKVFAYNTTLLVVGKILAVGSEVLTSLLSLYPLPAV
jgi:hypothetical protein